MRKPFAKRTGSAIAGAIRSGAARTAASLNGESCQWLEGRSLKRRGPDHRPPSGLGKLRHSAHPKPLLQRFEAASRIRSEEHTSALQSLMRKSYAVFCSKKKN